MKTKLLSLITVFAVIFNLIIPISYASDAELTLNIVGNKTTASAGDEIEYTIYGTTTHDLYTLEFYLDIPEGLTFVTGSGAIGTDFSGFDAKSFTENADYQFLFAKDPSFSLSNTVLGTFKCKVDDSSSGDYSVGIKDSEVMNSDFDVVEGSAISINPAGVTVNVGVTGVTLNTHEVTIANGSSTVLTANVSPDGATNKNIIWESSDNSVASVIDGTVEAKGKGTATITAKSDENPEIKDTCTVTVTQPVTSIFIMKGSSVWHELTMNVDDEETLTAEVNPSNADNQTVIWTSDDESVATVNNGTVKATGKGTTTITAKSAENEEVKATCKVTVGVGLDSISMNETSKTMRNGEEYTFSVVYTPSNTDVNKEVTWGSSNPEVAVVDNNGKVTVMKCSGTAEITATLKADNSKVAKATVTAAHKDEELTLNNAQTATCTEKGHTAYYSCSGCQDWFEDATGSVKIEDKSSIETPIDPDAHDWDEGKVTKEATCTEEGTKTYTCRRDGTHTRTEAIEKKPHTMQKTPAKSATCEEDGNIEYYTCSECNKLFKDEAGTEEISIDNTVIKATGHDWGEWTETTPATTESEGEETRVCKNDNSHKETRVIPKIHVHELVKTEAKDATCVAEGNIEYYTCSICNKIFSDSEGTTEVEDVTVAINPDAHDWNEWTTTKEPTCTEEGTKQRTCKNNASHVETESIDKVAHNLVKTDAKDATCEEKGNIEYYQCSECHKYFEDSTGNVEISVEDTVIEALGHDWDEGTVTKEASCTEKGIKTYTCKRNSSHTKTEDIEMLSHNWSEWTVTKEATCTEEGSKYRTCSVGNEKEESTIPAKGHDWEEWTIITPATVDEEGLKTRTCKNDSSHVETVTIDRIPYMIEDGNNQTFYYEQSSDLVITANGTLEKLVELKVDGETLDESNYTLESGSTIVTLKTAYLNTLDEKEHTLTFVYTDGQTSAKFKVAKANVDDGKEEENTTTENKTTDNSAAKTNSPKTGDTIMLWISLLLISGIGIFIISKYKKSNR